MRLYLTFHSTTAARTRSTSGSKKDKSHHSGKKDKSSKKDDASNAFFGTDDVEAEDDLFSSNSFMSNPKV